MTKFFPLTAQELFFEHIGFDLGERVEIGPGGVHLNGLFTMDELRVIARAYITYVQHFEPGPVVEQLGFSL
jgi:hypothetical protein